MSNLSGLAKRRVCEGCNYAHGHVICPATRKTTDWQRDAEGNKSRTVSGGVCAKAEG